MMYYRNTTSFKCQETKSLRNKCLHNFRPVVSEVSSWLWVILEINAFASKENARYNVKIYGNPLFWLFISDYYYYYYYYAKTVSFWAHFSKFCFSCFFLIKKLFTFLVNFHVSLIFILILTFMSLYFSYLILFILLSFNLILPIILL